MQLTDITIDAIWQNKNKQMVFSTEDLFCQEKDYDN